MSDTIDILLLLGPITDNQYRPVFDQMVKEGLSPQIVRLSTEFSYDRDFYNTAIVRARHNESAVKWIADKKGELIRLGFCGWSPQQVRSVVAFEVSDPMLSDADYMAWVKRLLPPAHTEHVIRTGADGTQWIEGDYGILEITPSDAVTLAPASH